MEYSEKFKLNERITFLELTIDLIKKKLKFLEYGIKENMTLKELLDKGNSTLMELEKQIKEVKEKLV